MVWCGIKMPWNEYRATGEEGENRRPFSERIVIGASPIGQVIFAEIRLAEVRRMEDLPLARAWVTALSPNPSLGLCFGVSWFDPLVSLLDLAL